MSTITREAFSALLAYAEDQICTHEETRRGGIWEICDYCGAKWADDEGGKPPFEWPEEIQKARALLDAATPKPAPHSDDTAVDLFSEAMKEKLAQKREEGRGGWENKEVCSVGFLASLLHGHMRKGDPVDIGNIAMMLWSRGCRGNGSIPQPTPAPLPREVVYALGLLLREGFADAYDAVCKHLDTKSTALADLQAQLAESESERHEQARLLGMSGEREAGLQAQLAARDVELAKLRRVAEAANKVRHWHDYEYEDGCQGMIVSADAVRELWGALEEAGYE